MNYLLKKIKGIVFRWRRATKHLPNFPLGTKVNMPYRIRRFMAPNVYLPARIVSPSGARHFFSKDPLDEHVFEQIIGSLSDLFFPLIPGEVINELNNGGCILDIGAFNGGWGVEMLTKYPFAHAIFLEPNPDKIKSINKTIKANYLNSRAQIIPAGLAKDTGKAWLVKADDGSWGDWLQNSKPNVINKTININTITLLDAIAENVPTIIKCNAEGGEFELVRQLLTASIRPKIMILMVHPEMGNVDNLWESLIQAEYKIEKINDHIRRPTWLVKWNQS